VIERDDQGWYWPSDDQLARRLVPEEASRDIPRLLGHCPRRGLIVQAGGNVGVWAKRLAPEFDTVICVEPQPTNYACLLMNEMPANVRTMHAALGDLPGWIGMALHEPGNYGAAQVTSVGSVRQETIDNLALPACDAIWLDIEGAELSALKGAVHTLARYRPMVMTENKGLGSTFGVAAGELERFMESKGYVVADQVGRDTVFVSGKGA
jgi:FkbM family methyltransferase